MKKIVPSVPPMRYHANDWNIVTKEEKEIERISGLKFLSSNSFYGRCVEWFLCDCYDLYKNKHRINRIINNRWFFVIITGKKYGRKIVLINDTDELVLMIKPYLESNPLEKITVTFVNMLQKCNGCCSGVVLSDGKGAMEIELMNNTVNTRDITDGTKDTSSMIYLETSPISLKITHGQNNSYICSNHFKTVINEIIRSCYRHAGYYEFIYGSNQLFTFANLYFTYFSDNHRYGFDKIKWD